MTTALRPEAPLVDAVGTGRPGLRSVPPASRRRSRRFAVAVIVAILAATALTTAVIHAQAVELRVSIDDLEAKNQHMSRKHTDKTVELAKVRTAGFASEHARAMGYEPAGVPDRVIAAEGGPRTAAEASQPASDGSEEPSGADLHEELAVGSDRPGTGAMP